MQERVDLEGRGTSRSADEHVKEAVAVSGIRSEA